MQKCSEIKQIQKFTYNLTECLLYDANFLWLKALKGLINIEFYICAAALLSRSKPSMISLAGGNPNPEYFPFQEAEFKLRYLFNLINFCRLRRKRPNTFNDFVGKFLQFFIFWQYLLLISRRGKAHPLIKSKIVWK